MESVKQPLFFKFLSYAIQILPMGSKRVSITLLDTLNNSEYHQKDLQLQNIGSSTLINALMKTKRELLLDIQSKKSGEKQMVELRVKVSSQFLKEVEEVIFIKKEKVLSQGQALQKTVNYLTKRLKETKYMMAQKEKSQMKDKVIYAVNPNEKPLTTGTGVQTIIEINLPVKGKYMIQWTFLAKATNNTFYCYLNSAQIPLLANHLINVGSHEYIPYSLRKVHNVVATQGQTITLQTQANQNQPVTFKNIVCTAKLIE